MRGSLALLEVGIIFISFVWTYHFMPLINYICTFIIQKQNINQLNDKPKLVIFTCNSSFHFYISLLLLTSKLKLLIIYTYKIIYRKYILYIKR